MYRIGGQLSYSLVLHLVIGLREPAFWCTAEGYDIPLSLTLTGTSSRVRPTSPPRRALRFLGVRPTESPRFCVATTTKRQIPVAPSASLDTGLGFFGCQQTAGECRTPLRRHPVKKPGPMCLHSSGSEAASAIRIRSRLLTFHYDLLNELLAGVIQRSNSSLFGGP